MIRMVANRRPNGRMGSAPMIYCDWCNKQISDVNMSMVKWEEDSEGFPFADSLVFLHKGQCDQLHSESHVNKRFAWDELRHFLGNIIHNVNRTDRDLWAYLVENHCPDEEIADVARVATRISENPNNRPPTMEELY